MGTSVRLVRLVTHATLRRRLGGLAAATLVMLAAAACSSDTTSPGGPTDTTSNGTTLTVDSVVNNQTAVVGSVIQITVHVRSATGAAVPNDTVRWNAAVGGGTVSDSINFTDVNGDAHIAWTLGTIAGLNTLGVNIPGAALPVNATGTVGPLAKLVAVGIDSQTVVATSSVLFTVRSTDQYGNVVTGIPISWSASAGEIEPASDSTGTSGNSDAVFTTSLSGTRYVITAMTAGIPAITFIIHTL